VRNGGVLSSEYLLDKDNLFKVFKFLHNEYLKLTLIDDFESHDIPPQDLDKLNKYTNPNYWQRIRENKSYKVQNGLKKNFSFLLKKYNLETLKQELEHKLIYKFWELINLNELELFEPKSA
jgi:hypothetical protein